MYTALLQHSPPHVLALHAPLLQEAVARGCKMLFLPENVSFLGTSFTEVRVLTAHIGSPFELAAAQAAILPFACRVVPDNSPGSVSIRPNRLLPH